MHVLTDERLYFRVDGFWRKVSSGNSIYTSIGLPYRRGQPEKEQDCITRESAALDEDTVW